MFDRLYAGRVSASSSGVKRIVSVDKPVSPTHQASTQPSIVVSVASNSSEVQDIAKETEKISAEYVKKIESVSSLLSSLQTGIPGVKYDTSPVSQAESAPSVKYGTSPLAHEPGS